MARRTPTNTQSTGQTRHLSPIAEPLYFEDPKAKPLKPSLALRKGIGNLLNYIYNIHLLQRDNAYRLAEDAFLVLYYSIR
jgi:hypothetical protein